VVLAQARKHTGRKQKRGNSVRKRDRGRNPPFMTLEGERDLGAPEGEGKK